jgi:hypothetical protein
MYFPRYCIIPVKFATHLVHAENLIFFLIGVPFLIFEAYEWVQREPAVGLLREPVEQQSHLRGRGQHQGRAGQISDILKGYCHETNIFFEGPKN